MITYPAGEELDDEDFPPEYEEPVYDFNDDALKDENCPNCGIEYDEIDYEYQICHHCKHENK